MCSTCTTVVDTAATNAVLVGAYALNSWDRLRDRARRRPRIERDVENWDANAGFLVDLGLDPLSTLGTRPAPPIVVEDRSTTTTG